MARINFSFSGVPTVEPDNRPLAYEDIKTTPAMFGGLVAEGEQKLGQGIERAGEGGLDYLQAKQHIDNTVHGAEVHSWLTDGATDLQSKFTELKGSAAMLALPKYKQDLEGLYQQALEQAGNPQTKAMVAVQARRTLDNFKEIGTRHADTQRDHWITKTAKDAADKYGNDAALFASRGMWTEMDRSLFNSGQEVRNYFEPQGYDKDTIATEVTKRYGANVKNIVESFAAEGNHDAAEKVYDKYKGEMDAGSRLAVESRLRADRSGLHGDNAGDQAIAETRGLTPGIASVRDTAAAALHDKGITLNVTSGYRSPEHNAEVGGARGSQHLHGRAIDVSLNGLDADQQQAVIDQFLSDPRVGGFGYYPKSNSIHVDVRQGDRAAWGSDYHNTSVGEGWPAWMTGKVRAWQGSAAPRQEMRDQYGPLDRASALDRALELTNGDPIAERRAVARITQQFSVERDERTQGLARFNRQIDDTVAEAGATGTVKVPLTEQDFIEHRKPGENEDDARERYGAYREELQFRGERHAMESMSAEEMWNLVEGRRPTPETVGPAGWDAAVKHHDRLQKAMNEVIANRRKDPAGSVAKDPTVGEAMQKYDPHKPETFRPVADARLAAQAQLGIERQDRSPITKEEALKEGGPLFHPPPGREIETVNAVQDRFRARYGLHWEQALAYAMAHGHEDQETRQYAGALIQKFIKNTVNAADLREADRRIELEAAARAVGRPPAAPAAPAPAATSPAAAPLPAPEAATPAAPAPSSVTPAPAAAKPAAAQPGPAQGGGAKPWTPQDTAREVAAEDRQRAAQELQDLERMEESRAERGGGRAPASARNEQRLQAGIEARRAEIFAQHPELKAPYEAAKTRKAEQAATEKFTTGLDDLAKEEAGIRRHVLPAAAQRRMAGQGEHAFDAKLAEIASRRQALVMMERQRLGIRSERAFVWPADKPFPAAVHIDELLHNPAKAATFDARYGVGATARILGRD